MAERLPILVVDDDAQMLRTMSDILRFRGYDPISAECGEAGVDAMNAARSMPAIAIVDLKLPDMDGIELVSRLRDIAPLVEIVILTGHASVESAVRALREHSYDYLVKPVAPENLVTSVARAGDRWQRRRAEAALEESELRLRRIFEGVSDAVFITDDQRRVIDANPAAEALLARSVESVRGAPLDTMLAPVLARVDVRSSAFAPGLYVHSVRDLSEQRRLEGALRHAQKMEAIGRLAGGVAHDFNNLLTVITSFSTLLADARSPEDPDRGILDEIRGAADRGAALTRQLLALSRKQVLAPRMLSINETIRGIEKIVKRLVGNDVHLRLSLDDNIPNVFADPGQLEQVLINLAANARDAMPHGGHLTITTKSGPPTSAESESSATESWMRLTVSDTGEGMTQETLEQIFEPFFTTKGDDRGTGLGLSIVHGIIAQSGGVISARSELGRGTTFEIELPPFEMRAASPTV